jgi:hypothetical protein
MFGCFSMTSCSGCHQRLLAERVQRASSRCTCPASHSLPLVQASPIIYCIQPFACLEPHLSVKRSRYARRWTHPLNYETQLHIAPSHHASFSHVSTKCYSTPTAIVMPPNILCNQPRPLVLLTSTTWMIFWPTPIPQRSCTLRMCRC